MREKLIIFLKKNSKLYKIIADFINFIEVNKKKNKLLLFFVDLLVGKKIVILKNSSVREYALEHNLKLKTQEPEKNRQVYVPVVYPIKLTDEVEEYSTYSIYSVCINNVIIVGANNILVKDGMCLNDKYELSYNDEFNFETGNVLEWDRQNAKVEISRKSRNIKEGIYLIGEAANNYYHWFFDIMSKLAYINQCEDIKDVPLLIDDTVARRETCLNLLNIIDEQNHKIIFIKRYCSYNVEKLYYFSQCTWSNVYVSSKVKTVNHARYAKSEFVIGYIRKQMNKKIEKEKIYSNKKRIFITRGKEYSERFYEEEKYAEIARKYGFEMYNPMDNSMMQQVVDFNSADCIIAVEGAALVNLIWCKPKTKVICVNPYVREDYLYSTLAYMVNVDCVYLDAKILNGKYHVNLKTYIECIEKILSE